MLLRPTGVTLEPLQLEPGALSDGVTLVWLATLPCDEPVLSRKPSAWAAALTCSLHENIVLIAWCGAVFQRVHAADPHQFERAADNLNVLNSAWYKTTIV